MYNSFLWKRKRNNITWYLPLHPQRCFEGPSNNLWKIPDYIDEINYVAEFNDKNFGDFLFKYFSHNYKPRGKRNVSANKGYKYYFDNGEISIETQELIESHPEYLKYSKYITT